MQVFLDECTSALDNRSEDVVYKELLRNCSTIVSIGGDENSCICSAFSYSLFAAHRESLKKFHSHQLLIKQNGSYSFTAL
jgi:ABC-type uncharacterized transport system fused permease/ATPase subunit